jgi:hypothetical protein
MSICGLDFGTSNTTLGTIEGFAPVLAALENGETTIPSAIFFELDGAVLIGRKAVGAYVEGAAHRGPYPGVSRAGAIVPGRRRRRVPDRRFGEARPCPQGNHQGSARIVEGDTFGAVGKGLTLEALRRYGPKSRGQHSKIIRE